MLPLGADALTIYLNDHLAGSTAGVELARRAARKNRSTAYGPALEDLAGEIARDRDALEDVMTRLGVSRDRLKILVSWSAEKAGRLKPNGELLRYTPLARLEDLELLLLAVEGKLALWRVLRRTHGADLRLVEVDLDELIQRGTAQRRRLEHERRLAADEALGG